MKEYELLKNYRVYRGLTQKQVAESLNMTHSGYSKYERGERKITIDLWMELSKILDIPFSALGTANNPDYLEQQYLYNYYEQYNKMAEDIISNKDKLSDSEIKSAFNIFKNTYERIETEKTKLLEIIKHDDFDELIKKLKLGDIFKTIYK
ncbi:MAG: helix-turn-helix domain-containing protein [Firmicutes bacterium]|nr:helix-turn-helix domain-containing protein [Bacillota bacterium]